MKALKSYGAYIANEEQAFRRCKTDEPALPSKFLLRNFDNLVNSFSGDGIKVLQKKISSDDVTEEVIDTKSRLEAKKQMRSVTSILLKQAKNMKEILEVQTEINSIQEEIESAAGRGSLSHHQSAYSTIHLSYFQYMIAGTKSPEETNSYFSVSKKVSARA
jgi:predicted RND superfamily exporter protein